MRGTRRTIVLLFVVALVHAGCSSGGNESTEAGGPPTTDPQLAAKAQAAVLQRTDFPPGFEPQPEEEGQGLALEKVWGELTRCLGVADAARGTGMATSPTFLRGLATQARATVEYAPESSSTALSAALAGPKFQSCAKEAFGADVKRSAPEGAVPGPVTLAALDVPPVTPKTFTSRINVTLDLEGLKVPLFQDFLVIFDEGAVIRMLFLNPGSEFPPDLERSLVEKVIARA